ncbi:hypothetical protein [Turneriella parva]|uniref:TIR domain-containing protein n=1 Tax=Turneriella parva (strain ATCC BAA-1111 / DSM 21527 / NCTC 11395 / H) TaxID=869212 RepID=I4BA93_TURPD|nr:hypothetical protein [Turneriella parva]AFM14200.1 hypothetical protein Turpa_3565 [Turneriella parva DSM 21527]
MYRGFKISFDEDPFETNEYLQGLARHALMQDRIESTLDAYLDINGVLNASKMQADWFPQVKADVFISHAHKDKDLAVSFAGWLHVAFGLSSFIDSCVWGHASVLQARIDKAFCYNSVTKTYDYTQRNYSTSHVHMMLATALTRMIDNCECLFFLNTPSSLTIEQAVKDVGKTLSPWIYHELAISQMLRPKKKTRERRFNRFGEKHYESLEKSDLQIAHHVDLSHLNTLDLGDLIKWAEACRSQTGADTLDVLYDQSPPRNDNRLYS